MPKWYKTTLNQSDILSGTHSKLQNDFETIFMALNAPSDMAMLSGRDPVAQKQPYYFAIPEHLEGIATKFLTTNSAQLSEPPKRSDTSLLVGHNDVWNLLK